MRELQNNNIIFDSELRESILKTFNTLSKSVGGTLGPLGTSVGLINQRIGKALVTNDGATVIENLAGKFQCPIEDYIFNLVKTQSKETDDQVGDGSTTMIVLLSAIVKEGLRSVELGYKQVDLVRGIKIATDNIIEMIDNKSKSTVDNPEFLRNIATISANNDPELGRLISDVFIQAGKDCEVDIKLSKDKEDSFKVIEGQKYYSGMYNSRFANREESAVLPNSKVLLYEGRLDSLEPLRETLGKIKGEEQSLLIIADDFTEALIADLVYNKETYDFKLCAIRSPGYGTAKEAAMDDLSVLTNSTVISPRFGTKIEDFKDGYLGTADNLVVTTEDFHIWQKKTDKKVIEAHIEKLKRLLNKSEEGNLSKELRGRIAKFKNASVELRLGSNAVLELQEKMFRIEDTINATRNALEEDVVAGGGITLFNCSNELKMPYLKNEGEEQGFKILLEALKVPLTTILTNAGEKSDVIVNNISDNESDTFGYNVGTREYGCQIEMGIMDPVKVTKGTLLGASSLARLIVSMDCVIY